MCYHLPDQYESIPLIFLAASLHTCDLFSNTLSLPCILLYSSFSECMAPAKRIMDRQLSDLPPHTHPDQPGLPPLHLNIHPCCCLIFPFNQDPPSLWLYSWGYWSDYLWSHYPLWLNLNIFGGLQYHSWPKFVVPHYIIENTHHIWWHWQNTYQFSRTLTQPHTIGYP